MHIHVFSLGAMKRAIWELLISIDTHDSCVVKLEEMFIHNSLDFILSSKPEAPQKRARGSDVVPAFFMLRPRMRL